MSYRDLRNFIEDMRVLGCPQQVSMESFRGPNWPLLESCVRWLAARVDPDAALGGSADTLEGRVALVSHALELFVPFEVPASTRLPASDRPAYQSELTALERELEALWDRYVLRYRCVEALKQQLSVLERAHSEQDMKKKNVRILIYSVLQNHRHLSDYANVLLLCDPIAPNDRGRCVVVVRSWCGRGVVVASAQAAAEQQAAVMQLIHKYEAEDVLGKLSATDDEDSSEASSSSGQSGGSGGGGAAAGGGGTARTQATHAAAHQHGRGAPRRAFGSMAARDSLDDVRPDSGSDSPRDLGRRVRAAGGRPGTRTLAGADDYADFGEGNDAIRDVGLDSESSSDSELQRAAALTDDEF
ncbi:unnamed protein product, partial [Iphiclides podalirius]